MSLLFSLLLILALTARGKNYCEHVLENLQTELAHAHAGSNCRQTAHTKNNFAAKE